MMKRLYTLFFFGGFLASVAAEVVRQPYIQLTTPDSAIIVWRSTEDVQPEIRISTTLEGLKSARSVAGPTHLQLKVRTSESDEEPLASGKSGPGPGVIQYEALVHGLSPNQRYFYAIKSVAEPDAEQYFKTFPDAGKSTDFTFWALGDSGTGKSQQAGVHTQMRAYLEKTGQQLDFALHLGDVVYPNANDQLFTQKYFDVYAQTLKNTAVFATVGNHDGSAAASKAGKGTYFDAYVLPRSGEAGGAPSGTEAYYSFDYGDVHFICLNSFGIERSTEGAMAEWLRADLEQTNARWLIAFWHHPPYTMGSKNGEKKPISVQMKKNFLPILEAGGVDFVLSGQSHIYERSMLVNGAYENPTTNKGTVFDDGDGSPGGDGAYRKSEGLNPNNGSVYVVAGNGGAPLSRLGTHILMKQILFEYGSVVMERRGDTLTGRMINKDGQISDLFAITKSGEVKHTPIENPKRLPPLDKPIPKDDSVYGKEK